MTHDEFANYRFSCFTKIMYMNQWNKLIQVDFIEEEVMIEFDGDYIIIGKLEIQDIREAADEKK